MSALFLKPYKESKTMTKDKEKIYWKPKGTKKEVKELLKRGWVKKGPSTEVNDFS